MTGTIRRWNERGYGFITLANGEEVFALRKDFTRCWPLPAKDDVVECGEIQPAPRDGLLRQARHITRIGSAPDAAALPRHFEP